MGTVKQIVQSYDASASLENASTIPAPWYTHEQIYDLELRTVFARRWQLLGRVDQLAEPGKYLTAEVAGEPLLVVRGSDNILRGFFNVCRHHAAAVMTELQGTAHQLRCPYHGWTYALNGELKGIPDFNGVCNFDRASNGLVPVDIAVWEKWVFARIEGETSGDDVPGSGDSLEKFLGASLLDQISRLTLSGLHWMERRHYSFDCNWKVFVDNYLDGGYHVPYLHKGLDSVLDYSRYMIENGEHFNLQWSPIVSIGAEAETGAVRKGERALYYWIYPNFMINHYDGVMDTNLVIPRGINKTEVIFDFYFPDVTDAGERNRNRASIEIGQRIQDEDVAICKSVQRGLSSRAYHSGRLSVRREAGEQLFHRLLYDDLNRAISDGDC